MGKFKRFILNLQFIFKPKYWIVSNEYSPKWDKELNGLLDEHTFDESIDGGYTAFLGNTCIWISNNPYGSFRPYGDKFNGLPNFRPSRLTIRRAYKQYISETKPSNDPYDKYN